MSLNKPIFILGDLNCNLLKSSDPASQALINVCSSHNLTQLTNLPTRITESPATLIDVILELNKNLVRDTKVIPVSSSDHNLVFAVLKLRRQRPTAGMYNDLGFKDYNTRLFSTIYLKSLGLTSTVSTTSKIAFMPSIFYSRKSWMNTHLENDQITEPTKPVFYGRDKRTYENKGLLTEVGKKDRRSRRLDRIQES